MARFVCRRWPECQPLIDRYIAETELPVSWTQQREIALHRIAEAGYTADDVAIVLRTIAHRYKIGMSGYTSMSLSFERSMERFEWFEAILLDVRKKMARRQATPKVIAPKLQIPTPAVSDEEAARLAEQAKQLSAQLRDQLFGR